MTLTVTDTGGNKASVTNAITVAGEPDLRPRARRVLQSRCERPGTRDHRRNRGRHWLGLLRHWRRPQTATPRPGGQRRLPSRARCPSALSKGLVISYSVNEQVAGQFQVLLASSVAKRIGLHGAPGHRPAPGLGAGDRDRESDSDHDEGRAQHGEDPVRQEDRRRNCANCATSR